MSLPICDVPQRPIYLVTLLPLHFLGRALALRGALATKCGGVKRLLPRLVSVFAFVITPGLSAATLFSVPADATPYVTTTGAFPPSAIVQPRMGGDGVANSGGETLPVGNTNNAGQTAAVFVFQLPDLGNVANPFASATFTATLQSSNAPFSFNPYSHALDLYGVASRAVGTVLASDFYLGGTGGETTPGTSLIQARFIDGTTSPGYTTNSDSFAPGTNFPTSPSGSNALVTYLNAQYAGGAGAGRFVFLRVNSNYQNGSYSGVTLYSGDAASAANRPAITYTLAGDAPPNTAPVLPALADRTIAPLAALSISNAATDADVPAQTLTYELLDAPAGAVIDSAGLITWTPTLEQASATYRFQTRVTDSGAPALSATNSFEVTVSAAPASPTSGVNLLTQNPGFEATANNFSNYHGSYSIPGWDGYNDLYNGHYAAFGSVAAGTTTEGARALHMDWAGTLSTAPAARPFATPGFFYELRYDLRTLVGNFPTDLLGTFSYLDFFDASGTRIKSVWGPDWFPQSQARGVAPWETITVRGLAPPGTVSVGVRVRAPSGIYYNSDYDRSQNRHIEVDNFRLYRIDESLDRVAVRRAPRLVEPGRDARLRIHAAATADRSLVVRLIDANNIVRAEVVTDVPAGRGLHAVTVPVPANLPAGTYAWEMGLVPTNGSWVDVLGPVRVAGVICDESVVSPPAGTNEFLPNHPRILYMGRWTDSDPLHPVAHWFGSEMRVRFTGTSLALRASINTLFGAPRPSDVSVVIDEDAANLRIVNIDRYDGTFVLAENLSPGVHTARIFKNTESDGQIRVDGLIVDAGAGLLVPEPLPTRKLEIFGDSVTSGGEAIPRYFAYAPTLGRELDADVHIISKGGTGVASSFSGQATLLQYWDNLAHPNVFWAPDGTKWDLTRWIPDAVLITIGHNDQFNDGGAIFPARYADFHAAVRAAYPAAQIVAGNTVISAPIAHFQNAIEPLLADDPRMAFVFQINQYEEQLYGHPSTGGHQAMVRGDIDRFSYADVLEDRLGWGLDRPLSGYERWVVENFTPTQIAAGSYGPTADVAKTDVPNVVRYALDLPTSAPSPAALPQSEVDSSGRLTLTFNRLRADARYVVEVSSDLKVWTPAAVNPGVVGGAVKFVDSAPVGERRFARLRVELPADGFRP